MYCTLNTYQDQFRGFKSHRVHARRGLFLQRKLISGKRETVSLATFDENGKHTNSGRAGISCADVFFVSCFFFNHDFYSPA